MLRVLPEVYTDVSELAKLGLDMLRRQRTAANVSGPLDLAMGRRIAALEASLKKWQRAEGLAD